MTNYETQDLQYLQMMQENITRMAGNSANAKTWLITIVTGFFAIGCSIKDLDWWLLLAIIPIVVFWYIDAYYLSLERALRNREQIYINILNSLERTGDNLIDEKQNTLLFDFRPLFMDNDDDDRKLKKTKCMMLNKSVYPVYLIMLFLIIVATVVINMCN